VDAAPLLDRVLDDEGLTAGLDEAEAMLLVQALSARVRKLAEEVKDDATARQQVDDVCRTARKISDVVSTFRDAGEATARTTAGRYGFRWPVGIKNQAELLGRLLTDQCRAG
jgi:hypothetical protein